MLVQSQLGSTVAFEIDNISLIISFISRSVVRNEMAGANSTSQSITGELERFPPSILSFGWCCCNFKGGRPPCRTMWFWMQPPICGWRREKAIYDLATTWTTLRSLISLISILELTLRSRTEFLMDLQRDLILFSTSQEKSGLNTLHSAQSSKNWEFFFQILPILLEKIN